MASSGWENCVKVWDMKLRKQLWQVKHEGVVWCVKVHGDMVISASGDRTMKLWNRDNGRLRHTLQNDTACLNFDICHNILAVAAGDGIYIWSLKDQRRIRKIELGGVVVDVRYQGQQLIAARKSGEVYAIKIE